MGTGGNRFVTLVPRALACDRVLSRSLACDRERFGSLPRRTIQFTPSVQGLAVSDPSYRSCIRNIGSGPIAPTPTAGGSLEEWKCTWARSHRASDTIIQLPGAASSLNGVPVVDDYGRGVVVVQLDGRRVRKGF